VERLGHEPVLLGDLNEPIDEDAAHRRVDVALRLHKMGRDAELALEHAQVAVDVLHVLVALLRVGREVERRPRRRRRHRVVHRHRLGARRRLLRRRLLRRQRALPHPARDAHVGRRVPLDAALRRSVGSDVAKVAERRASRRHVPKTSEECGAFDGLERAVGGEKRARLRAVPGRWVDGDSFRR
jgi:hypothetical protein